VTAKGLIGSPSPTQSHDVLQHHLVRKCSNHHHSMRTTADVRAAARRMQPWWRRAPGATVLPTASAFRGRNIITAAVVGLCAPGAIPRVVTTTDDMRRLGRRLRAIFAKPPPPPLDDRFVHTYCLSPHTIGSDNLQLYAECGDEGVHFSCMALEYPSLNGQSRALSDVCANDL